jgi:polyisoprenoid-binding protein YceI
VAIISVGWLAYDAVLGETEAPSGQLTAVPLVVNTAAPVEPTATTASAAEATATPQAVASGTEPTLFQIIAAESQVSFAIYEELGGQPVTVVGTSNEVAGQIALNLSDLSQTQVGVIQVNARTLATDNNRRNNAIRNFILNTDQYELITFTPTAISGLSGTAQAGQAFTFQITGDLTIRDVTQSVVFEVTASGESATRLTGTATTVIQRSAFNLSIPTVPNVANVGEDVTLEIKFVAGA